MSKSDFEFFVQGIQVEGAEERHLILQQLFSAQHPRLLEILLRTIVEVEADGSKDQVLEDIISVLSRLPKGQGISYLQQLLESEMPSIFIKQKIAETLAKLGNFDYLLLAVESSNETIRAAALYGLGYAHETEPNVFDISLAKLSDKNPEVKVAAIGNLMDIGDRRAIPALRMLLGNSEITELGETIGEAAQDAIEFLEEDFN